jgi:hypothetical protein
MKVQDFAYRVANRTMELLEQMQHYKVSDEHRKQVLEELVKEVDSLLKQSS